MIRLTDIADVYIEKIPAKGGILGYYVLWVETHNIVPGSGCFMTKKGATEWLKENEDNIVREWYYKLEKILQG